MFRQLRISKQLIILFGLVITLSVILSTGFALFRQSQELRKTLEDRGRNLSELTREYLFTPLYFNDRDDVVELVEGLAQNEDINFVIAQKPDGTIVSQTGNAESVPDDVRARISTFAQQQGETVLVDMPDQLLVALPVSDKSVNAGTLLVGLSFEMMRSQLQTSALQLISFSLVWIILGLVGTVLIARFISKPIDKMTEAAGAISQGNYDVSLPPAPSQELGDLSAAFEQMTNQIQGLIENLEAQVAARTQRAESARKEAEEARTEAEQAKKEIEKANETLEVQMWQSAGLAELNDKTRGQLDIPALAKNIIQQLCQYLQVQVGAMYIREDSALNLVGSYAYANGDSAGSYKVGEGLVGQAALDRKPMVVTDIPKNHIPINLGLLGEAVPNNMMVFPIMHENRVTGVVEMGTLTEFTQAQMDFLDAAMGNIAITINTAQARTRIDELLSKTQSQAEDLQAQGEELRVINEELEAQTESLQASEIQLKEKQAQLEATNTQLEEKAADLEESTAALEENQSTLDKQNQELKLAQVNLEQKAEELALASKYKSEFLANMSHELRTPLNSLLILASMLTDNKQGNLTEEQIESAQIIYNGGQDLLNLINDILDLSKVESGKMTFTFEAMPLTDVASMVKTQFAHVAEEKGLDLNVTLAHNLPSSISTDKQRVKQIIKNLVSNAFKFTAVGSVSLNIFQPDNEVDLSRSGLDPSQAVAISVVDTGIGMTPDQQKIIFEAFQQADGSTSRQYGGTGLGLSISRELALKLGGQLTVTSNTGQGSTFTLYLPVDDQITEEKEASRTPVAKIIVPQTTKPPMSQHAAAPVLSPSPFPDDRAEVSAGDKILLVIEDDPKFAKVVYNFSHEKGFKCLVAPDGQTALALIKNYTPTAIILDLHLPDISGWGVLDVLKNDPATRHIPVHIMSVDEEVLDAYRKGAMGYLTKPVNEAALNESFQSIEQFLSKEIKDLLLVEDDANARHSIKMLLGGSDVRISEAEEGQAALDMLHTQHFDCVILDLTLPDMNGFEVLSQMNGNNSKAKCPVIVYTGRDLTPEENDELMKHADSVIVKGVKSPERLLDETALFLHRVVADMPVEKQETIKQLYYEDGLLTDKKILVVDDDIRNSFALSKLLTDRGLAVRIARDGQQALDSLAKDPNVDLVLMDIMMPVMDGYETIRNIRAKQEFKGLPILAFTAKAMKGDKEKCLAAGANDYLPKPIDIDRLFSMLRVWLYQ